MRITRSTCLYRISYKYVAPLQSIGGARCSGLMLGSGNKEIGIGTSIAHHTCTNSEDFASSCVPGVEHSFWTTRASLAYTLPGILSYSTTFPAFIHALLTFPATMQPCTHLTATWERNFGATCSHILSFLTMPLVGSNTSYPRDSRQQRGCSWHT